MRCSGGTTRKITAHEPAAVFHHDVFLADHGGLAAEDAVAARVQYQVRMDNAVVQRVRVVGRRSSVVGLKDLRLPPKANDRRRTTNN